MTKDNQESYKTKAKKDKRQKQPNSEPDPGGDNNQQIQKAKDKKIQKKRMLSSWN